MGGARCLSPGRLHVELDRRAKGVAGAATQSPHGLVQEFLNRSDKHLWGFVSNGLVLRTLRDNTSLTRQAYAEFDLAGMMDGEVFADFAVLWMLCHQSRVEAERPEECWLERWSQAAAEQGTRALEGLRQGVEEAITALGSGFLSHRANVELRRLFARGSFRRRTTTGSCSGLCTRLLFLFVAEDRQLLFDPGADSDARERYERYYSTRRLRDMAQRRRGTRHADPLRRAKAGDGEARRGGRLPNARSSSAWELFSGRSRRTVIWALLGSRTRISSRRSDRSLSLSRTRCSGPSTIGTLVPRNLVPFMNRCSSSTRN